MIRYISIILFLLIAVQCTTETTLPLNNQSYLVINSIIGADSIPVINLSTNNTNTTPITNINNAQVIINHKNKQHQLTYIGNGNYSLSSLKFSEGESYNVTVNHNNNMVTASTTTPKTVPFKIIKQTYDDSSNHSSFTIRFNDIPNQDDYYMLIINQLDTDSNKIYNANIPFYSNHIVFENNLTLEDVEIASNLSKDSRSFSDAFFKNKSVDINFYTYFEKEDLEILLYHIPKAYFYYERSLIAIKNHKESVFRKTPPIYSNCNTGLGIFTSYAVSRIIVR